MGMLMILPNAGRMGKDLRVKGRTMPGVARAPDTRGRVRVKEGCWLWEERLRGQGKPAPEGRSSFPVLWAL